MYEQCEPRSRKVQSRDCQCCFSSFTCQVHLRSYIQLKADDVGGVLSGLADVNAYDSRLITKGSLVRATLSFLCEAKG